MIWLQKTQEPITKAELMRVMEDLLQKLNSEKEIVDVGKEYEFDLSMDYYETLNMVSTFHGVQLVFYPISPKRSISLNRIIRYSK